MVILSDLVGFELILLKKLSGNYRIYLENKYFIQ